MADQGHWYTDKNGNHYLVKNGETPKEGWERSKRRKMIDGGKYKVDDGDGKGSREVSMEEYNKYEADDDFDETTDDDFGFDEEEEEYGDPRLQANADVVSEMMERGINVHDEGAVLDFLDGENYEEEDKREIVQYIRSMVPEDEDEDESLENTDNRGEGANPDFNREKFGKYFNPDGTLKKGMEDEYFAATRGESGDEESDNITDANENDKTLEELWKEAYPLMDQEQRDSFNKAYNTSSVSELRDMLGKIISKNGKSDGKKNPNGSEQNVPDAKKTDDQKKAAMKAKAKAKRDKEIQSMGKEIVEYYNGDPIDEDEVADILGGEYGYNQRMVNAIIKWVKENQ